MAGGLKALAFQHYFSATKRIVFNHHAAVLPFSINEKCRCKILQPLCYPASEKSLRVLVGHGDPFVRAKQDFIRREIKETEQAAPVTIKIGKVKMAAIIDKISIRGSG